MKKVLKKIQNLVPAFCAAYCLCFSASAANGIKLQMALTLNGKTIYPELVALPGETATIVERGDSGSGLEISVRPTLGYLERSAKQVELAFIISRVEQGRKEKIASPRVITRLGEIAVLQQNKERSRGRRYDLELKVTATEQN